MTAKLTLILLSILLIASCSDNTRNKQAIVLLNNDSSVINQTEDMIKKYGDKHFKHSEVVVYAADTTVVDCFYENQHPKIIRVNQLSKNEEGLIDTSAEVFYLGEDEGFPIVYTYDDIIPKETSRQVIMKNRDVFSYLLREGKEPYINPLDSFDKETKISAITFLLVNQLLHFKNLNYQMLRASINSMPVMITLKDSILLYNEANLTSDKTRLLKEGELLYYIDYKNNEPQPFLKVATEDKKHTGWIIWDNKTIRFYTDGD